MATLSLGTAQLGLNYGINNKSGKPSLANSLAILNYALDSKIDHYDTASAYGNSEEIIGKWITQNQTTNQIEVTSKLASLNKQNVPASKLYDYVLDNLKTSLKHMNLKKINYYLVHDFNDVLKYGADLTKILQSFKDDGLINHYGFSIYELGELEYLNQFSFDALQIPCNLFNQYILESPLLESTKKNGTRIFARSVFLQGLFFIASHQLPNNLINLKKHMITLEKIAKKNNTTPMTLSYNYIKNHRNIDTLIFGVETLEQLQEILKIKSLNNLDYESLSAPFKNINLELVDPRFWR